MASPIQWTWTWTNSSDGQGGLACSGPLSCKESDMTWQLNDNKDISYKDKVYKGKNAATAVTAAESLQSCPTLCDPIDGSPSGSPVPGILQARTLEWVAISFSNAWKWKVKVKSLSCVRPSATSWTAAFQAPPSMRFSRQEYWSGDAIAFPDSNITST